MRLILTGDIHIGRSSSRIPDTVGKESLRAGSAWNRIVDLAIKQGADIVCLSGDIADQTNKFWEAIGPLRKGILRLSENSIQTVAVAGNHDFDVLPKLADQLSPEFFKLLGRNGKWERTLIELKNGEALNIDGWSFPSQKVSVSPLDSYDLESDPHVPTLGMIHGDLFKSTSPYAPLQLNRLQSTAPGGWLLGHIHAPELIAGTPWVLYPGSPQALDPGEKGPHGPWILDIQNGLIGLPAQQPISTVWYNESSIDLSHAEDQSELQSAILDGIATIQKDILNRAGPFLAHTSLRFQLTGHTAISHQVNQATEQVIADLDLPAISVDKIVNKTLPFIDLKEYARTTTAAGAVAKLLLQLENDQVSEEVATLIRSTREKLIDLNRSGNYGGLPPREITGEMAREYLNTTGRALLTQLVSQTNE
ncbi:MAG: DNA repair exonuclease [Candidatus Sabulitectum sp.]|nr:DNA repair exonuclease [Candidatus Sabulitectum sp.]